VRRSRVPSLLDIFNGHHCLGPWGCGGRQVTAGEMVSRRDQASLGHAVVLLCSLWRRDVDMSLGRDPGSRPARTRSERSRPSLGPIPSYLLDSSAEPNFKTCFGACGRRATLQSSVLCASDGSQNSSSRGPLWQVFGRTKVNSLEDVGRQCWVVPGTRCDSSEWLRWVRLVSSYHLLEGLRSRELLPGIRKARLFQ
jgi:hypothetical protein